MDERRETKRTLASVFIRFDVDDGKEQITGFTQDISTEGICVLSREELNLFESLNMNIDIPNNPDIMQAEGNVRWVSKNAVFDDAGRKTYPVGIAFTYIDRQDREYLQEFIRIKEEVLK